MTSALRRFLREPAKAPQEKCELCATPVPPQHPHLVQVAERRMVCACGPCGFLFLCQGARFDLAGRFFDGSPASVNLRIPPYSFPNPTTLVIGHDEASAKEEA